MKKCHLIVDHRGIPQEAYEDEALCLSELKKKNDSLSPWEKMAGYFYSYKVIDLISSSS